MQTVKQYPQGNFCWIDLAALDVEAARAFYTGLFGWETEDVPTGGDMTYTMCRHLGEDVCALYAMGAQMRTAGIPSHWASYVSVADADAAAERAASLGATVQGAPFDVLDVGRMAMVQDPTGAWFNLWQPRRHIGATLVNHPGAWCWNELATRDTDAAARFYGGMFGWTTTVSDGANGPYTAFHLGERLAGGMMGMGPEWGDMPPSWAVYFAVEDCAATVARAGELGGDVILPETAVPEIGRLAVLRDPQGAAFSVIAMERADPPP